MQIVEKKEDGVLVVQPCDSRLDAHAAVGFKQKMEELIDGGNHQIVLDLGSVEFIDSSGLGAIVSSMKRLGGNGNIVICRVQSTPLNMFKLTRMDKVFQIFEDEDQAKSSLAA